MTREDSCPHPRLGVKRYGGGSISRILFRIDRACGGDHVSTAYVTISLQRPTREPRPGRPLPNVPAHLRTAFAVQSQAGRSARPPIWSCSGCCLPCHPRRPRTRWALTPPFHPYPSPSGDGPGRYIFCGAHVGLLRPGRYPAPCPVESGLSSCLKSGKRPPDPRPHTAGTMIRNACVGNKRRAGENVQETLIHPSVLEPRVLRSPRVQAFHGARLHNTKCNDSRDRSTDRRPASHWRPTGEEFVIDTPGRFHPERWLPPRASWKI